MVTMVKINGYDGFLSYLQTIDPNGPMILFYFSGSKNAEGRSWCPDCEEDMPKKAPKKQILELKSYEDFTTFVENLSAKDKHVYFFFNGSKKENGRSWCMYCQLAEPIVQAYLNEVKKDFIFAYVDVGDRDYWKNKDCPFRTDNRTRLMVIPTIIKWKGVQRLEGSQCNKRDLLQMLFEDDED